MPSVLVDTDTDGTTLVSGVSGKTIRVLGINLTADGQVTVTLKSNTAVIWKTFAMNDASVLGGIVVPFNKDRELDCEVGESLVLGLSGTVDVAGTIDYAFVGGP